MALGIETFSNLTGGNALYKALAHPLAGERYRALAERLAARGPVAIYDPLGYANSFAALYDLERIELVACFVQRIEALGGTLLGRSVEPVTALPGTQAKTLLIAAFDAERLRRQIAHLIPVGMGVETFDALRLPEELLTNPRTYLDPLNFATNFAFFRDAEGHHTRLVTANYWTGHGAQASALWLRLYDAEGAVLAEWREELPPRPAPVVLDSRAIRVRFALPEFTGSLFLHVVGAAGHDVVKYALDTYGDDPSVLSATHDANAWPADLYAGLPAPRAGERVVLWVQNSHPVPIPPKRIGLNRMGDERIAWYPEAVPPFGTRALEVGRLLPELRWPEQIEVQAGRYFVRPRYEVFGDEGRSRIAHVNVERTDLKPDPRLRELGNLLGKGYILPAPILPPERFETIALLTPMSTAQRELPVQAIVVDGSGREVARRRLGRVKRRHSVALELDDILEHSSAQLESGYGHLEFVYDFADGGEADGWLHALFRYRERTSGHIAETSFGAHVYNLPITYRGEPQSYIGKPPGLSTRLFLRLGPEPCETLTHLIYPASQPWHGHSETDLVLYDKAGEEVARRRIAIPCGGSRLVAISELFDGVVHSGYVIVRDSTCRLFGYHALLGSNGAFSLDHMFGF
ncbi:MAG TPA: hypothetical protein VJN41_01340 [Alphaproteobacteria bacterium]|nr:hypothetical protein [Alphaproteobacteria bacterium]